jgi:transcriptional regulator with XRE-family HTH domain
MFMDTIGKRIRFIRGEMSQAEFAKKVGINKSTLGRYERDVNSPDAKSIELICDSFMIQPKWLLTGEGSFEATPNKDALVGKSPKDDHYGLYEDVLGKKYNTDILHPITDALKEALSELHLQVSERHFYAISLLLYEEFLDRVSILAGKPGRTFSK